MSPLTTLNTYRFAASSGGGRFTRSAVNAGPVASSVVVPASAVVPAHIRKPRRSNDGTTDVWMSDVLPAPEGECRSMMRPDSNELATDAASRSRPKNSSSLRNGRGPTYGFTRLLDDSRWAVATTADDEEDPVD